MKRLILTSMLTAAGLFAQATPSQPAAAQSTPQTPSSKTTAPVKKHRKSHKKAITPASSQPKAASKAPVAKQ